MRINSGNPFTLTYLFFLIIVLLPFNSAHSQGRGVELSHYLFPEFSRGVILLQYGERHNVLLNYNSITEEMVFENRGRRLALDEATVLQLDTIFIGDRRFIRENDKFLEVLHLGQTELYVEHKCRVIPPGSPAGYGQTSQTSATTSISQMEASGNVYEMKLPDGFLPRPYVQYWIRKNGELQQVGNMRQLRRIYGDQRDAFNAYNRENAVDFDDYASIARLVSSLDEHE